MKRLKLKDAPKFIVYPVGAPRKETNCRICGKKIEDFFRRIYCSRYCEREAHYRRVKTTYKDRRYVYKKKGFYAIPTQLCQRCKRTLGRIKLSDYTTIEKNFTDGEKLYSIKMEYKDDPHVHIHYINGRGFMGLKNVKNQFKLKALRMSKKYIELTETFDDIIRSVGIDKMCIGKKDGLEYNRFLNIKMIGGHFYGERIHMYVAKNKVFKFHYFPDGKRKKLLEEEFKDHHYAKKEFDKLIYRERTTLINETYKKENRISVP